MRIGRWVLGLAALALLCGSATAQVSPDDFNRICIHNGSDYYVNMGWAPRGTPNMGTGHYTPNYTHVASTLAPSGYYDWKIRGWSWVMMKALNIATPNWQLLTTMQAVFANHYNYVAIPSVTMSCTFPAALGYIPCGGPLPTAGWQSPIWSYGGGGLPSALPAIGGKDLLFPSSSTWSSAVNIFSIGAGTLSAPSSPYYGFGFAFTFLSAGVATIPSAASIWQWVWDDQAAPFDYQYCLFSGNEMENRTNWPYNSADPTTQTPGLKAKSFFFGYAPPYIYGWLPWQGGTGYGGIEMQSDMCLFVDDTVAVAVNYGIGIPSHPASNLGNPFNAYGHDVGITTLTPVVSKGAGPAGNPKFRVATEAHSNPGGQYVILGSRNFGTVAYANPFGDRLPVKFPDPFMNFFLGPVMANLAHFVSSGGYPACAFGNPGGQNGGHSNAVNIGTKFQATLPCKETRICSFSTTGKSPSASYMFTWK